MACAWQFAELGSKLILLGRREDRLEELKKAITDEYPEVKVLTGKIMRRMIAIIVMKLSV